MPTSGPRPPFAGSLAVLAVLAGCGSPAAGADPAPRRPNIILIVADDKG